MKSLLSAIGIAGIVVFSSVSYAESGTQKIKEKDLPNVNSPEWKVYYIAESEQILAVSYSNTKEKRRVKFSYELKSREYNEKGEVKNYNLGNAILFWEDSNNNGVFDDEEMREVIPNEKPATCPINPKGGKLV